MTRRWANVADAPSRPNDTLLLSFENDLTTNWREASGDFESGIVQIISADHNASSATCDPGKACNGGCDPSRAYSPAPELNGGITKPQRIGNMLGITETQLTDNGTADPGEQRFSHRAMRQYRGQRLAPRHLFMRTESATRRA